MVLLCNKRAAPPFPSPGSRAHQRHQPAPHIGFCVVSKPPFPSCKGPAEAKISLFWPKPPFSSRKHESGPVVRPTWPGQSSLRKHAAPTPSRPPGSRAHQRHQPAPHIGLLGHRSICVVSKPPFSSRKPGVGPAGAKISLFRPKPPFSSRKHGSGPVVGPTWPGQGSWSFSERAAPSFPSSRVTSPSASPTCVPNRPSGPLVHLRSTQTPFLAPKTWGWASWL